ncbi:MAG: hotdog fold thioesterase [Saprospiraceae bacterium]|nr:hotdog fold thioesterase [Saprospiraceae bacterium]
MIWKNLATLEVMNAMSKNTLVENLGIEFIEVGDDYLKAKMPVDDRTVQPYRLLHGGASAALAETMGSVAGVAVLDDPSTHMPVGVEINANHLRSATSGHVYATVKPIRIGKRIQVWNIDIEDDQGELVCVSRLTIAVIARRS